MERISELADGMTHDLVGCRLRRTDGRIHKRLHQDRQHFGDSAGLMLSLNTRSGLNLIVASSLRLGKDDLDLAHHETPCLKDQRFGLHDKPPWVRMELDSI